MTPRQRHPTTTITAALWLLANGERPADVARWARIPRPTLRHHARRAGHRDRRRTNPPNPTLDELNARRRRPAPPRPGPPLTPRTRTTYHRGGRPV